jgi:hypothetical protein
MLEASEIERLYAHLGRAYTFLNACEKAQEVCEELVTYAQQQHLPMLGSRTLNRLAILAVEQLFDKPGAPGCWRTPGRWPRPVTIRRH